MLEFELDELKFQHQHLIVHVIDVLDAHQHNHHPDDQQLEHLVLERHWHCNNSHHLEYY